MLVAILLFDMEFVVNLSHYKGDNACMTGLARYFARTTLIKHHAQNCCLAGQHGFGWAPGAMRQAHHESR
jgi:hypothetical protein